MSPQADRHQLARASDLIVTQETAGCSELQGVVQSPDIFADRAVIR